MNHFKAGDKEPISLTTEQLEKVVSVLNLYTGDCLRTVSKNMQKKATDLLIQEYNEVKAIIRLLTV